MRRILSGVRRFSRGVRSCLRCSRIKRALVFTSFFIGKNDPPTIFTESNGPTVQLRKGALTRVQRDKYLDTAFAKDYLVPGVTLVMGLCGSLPDQDNSNHSW